MGDYNDAFNRNRDAAVQARTKAQNRANVLQLKLIGQSHPTGLTSNLLKLFEPRPPLEHKPPPERRKCLPYTGMAQYVSNFAEPGDPEYAPPVQKAETPAERRARIHKFRLEKGAQMAVEELQKYDPSNDPNATGDPYKTLFVARLSYETTEHRIKREFEAYGPIKRVRLITDKATNKPRGYAFIEYMHTRDMKTAYKQADGRKLDNRRVLVDVERGRTVPNWRPRRLGGGLGSTRVGGEDLNQKYSGREPQQIASGASRSEEPKARDDRHADRDMEKSRERGRERDRERERSRERSFDRNRDRDDRHYRDRDRARDRDRERERGHDRDRHRDRDRGREHDRDRDRERGRDRGRDRDRDYDRGDSEHDHGRTRGRDPDFERIEPRLERGQPDEKEREYDLGEAEYDNDWYEHGRGYGHSEADHGHRHYEHQHDQDQYEHDGRHNEPEPYGHGVGEHGHERYDEMEPDDFPQDGDYQRTDRSLSRDRQ